MNGGGGGGGGRSSSVLYSVKCVKYSVIFQHTLINLFRLFLGLVRTNFPLTYFHIFRMSNSTFTKDNYPGLKIIELIPPTARILISKSNHYIQTGAINVILLSEFIMS